jgi:thioredoxin-related protein
MLRKKIPLAVLLILLLCSTASIGAPGKQVVYPDWFKQSFYDLQDDLQQAKDDGKQGLAVFFSEKSCSFCIAMVERTFKEPDIAQRLQQNYEFVSMDVFSDLEMVDPVGNSHWIKDFAIREKAQFTPTIIFYGIDGAALLRIVGYQSPDRMRTVLDYLDGGYHSRMTLRQYANQKTTAKLESAKTEPVNLQLDNKNTKPVLVIFESPECEKCQQFRTMLQAPIMQPYLQQMRLAFVSSGPHQQVVTPSGQTMTGKAWSDQLGLLHSPAMVYFDEQGKEGLRVDFDLLVDAEGNPIASDNARVLNSIRARLEYMITKGYERIPQFQRWRASVRKQGSGS